MKIAVVGATGMVGEIMLRVLEERNFPISELLLVASERSVGKTLRFKNTSYTVIGLETAVAAPASPRISNQTFDYINLSIHYGNRGQGGSTIRT
jgi:aspartate-semialdehyde dehydrogenase